MNDEICPCYSELKGECRIDNSNCIDKFMRCSVVDILLDNLAISKENVIEKKKLVAKYNGMKMFKNELIRAEFKVASLEINFKD